MLLNIKLKNYIRHCFVAYILYIGVEVFFLLKKAFTPIILREKKETLNYTVNANWNYILAAVY